MRPLLIFSLYLAISLIYFGRGLPGHFGDYYVGRETDHGVHMWFFNWWRFSLSHGLNPFLTDWVWAPLGINLAWTTCVPLPSLISIPLQVTVGEPATYNIIAMLMLPLAAFSAFLLCRRVTGAFWPSVLGGYIFGFSPYLLGEALGHLVCIAVFPVPLIALIALKRLDEEISAARFAAIFATLLVIQLLCSVEVFATVTLVGGFSLFACPYFFRRRRSHPAPTPDRSDRQRIRDFRSHTLTLLLLLARLRASGRADLATELLLRGSDWIPRAATDHLVGFRRLCNRDLAPLCRRHHGERRLSRYRVDRVRRGIPSRLLAEAGR